VRCLVYYIEIYMTFSLY